MRFTISGPEMLGLISKVELYLEANQADGNPSHQHHQHTNTTEPIIHHQQDDGKGTGFVSVLADSEIVSLVCL